MNTTRKLSLAPFREVVLGAPRSEPWLVSKEDPAQSVMTDFHERSAVTVSVDAPIDVALEHMKHAGVRAAFVLSSDQYSVLGMITAYDIQGEKPFRYLQSIDGTHRSASHDVVHVQDIMDKARDWHVVEMRDIEKATIGMALDLFDATHRTHVVVVERSKEQGVRLRGLLSAAKIRRLLGE